MGGHSLLLLSHSVLERCDVTVTWWALVHPCELSVMILLPDTQSKDITSSLTSPVSSPLLIENTFSIHLNSLMIQFCHGDIFYTKKQNKTKLQFAHELGSTC